MVRVRAWCVVAYLSRVLRETAGNEVAEIL